MRQRSLIVLAGFLTLIASGCSTDSSSVAPSPSPVASSASPQPAQPFAKPLVAQKPGGSTAVAGLIQPVNPDERARQVQATITARQNARDPFANIPPTINIKTPISAPARRITTIPNLPRLPKPGVTAGRQFNPGGGNLFPPGSTPSLPKSPIANLPPLPQPDLARAVQVTGVVRVAGVTQAIVVAPDEPTSRYVRVGQRLSNGQILVKRIEMTEGADPIVILEQNGVEVAKAVGEKPAQKEGSQQQASNGSVPTS